jgi:hypothetical protein
MFSRASFRAVHSTLSLPLEGQKGRIRRVKDCWLIIADNLSKAGWSWGCVSDVDSNERTIFLADAHRAGEKRFVVRADEKLTAFVELELAIRVNG